MTHSIDAMKAHITGRHLFPANDIGGVGTTDSRQTLRMMDAIHRQHDENMRAAAERAWNEVKLRNAYRDAVQAGDVNAPATFVPRKWPGNRVPAVWEVVYDSLDARDFIPRAMALLVKRANEGDEEAQLLLSLAGAHFADSECDYVGSAQ